MLRWDFNVKLHKAFLIYLDICLYEFWYKNVIRIIWKYFFCSTVLLKMCLIADFISISVRVRLLFFYGQFVRFTIEITGYTKYDLSSVVEMLQSSGIVCNIVFQNKSTLFSTGHFNRAIYKYSDRFTHFTIFFSGIWVRSIPAFHE